MERGLKINMFTGPVLNDDDPIFKTTVNGDNQIRIPTLFWKVIYFRRDSDGKMYKVGFLMGQEELLEQSGIVFPRDESRDVFMEFKKADTYQVSLATIQDLTNIQFPPAYELYKKADATVLTKIVERVQARDVLEGEGNRLAYEIEGLTL